MYEIIEKLSKLFNIFDKIFNKYKQYLEGINVYNVDTALTPNCEFELMSKIPCPFRKYFIKRYLDSLNNDTKITVHNFSEDIIHLESKFGYLMVQSQNE